MSILKRQGGLWAGLGLRMIWSMFDVSSVFAADNYSALWRENGELWEADGRLHDFSMWGIDLAKKHGHFLDHPHQRHLNLVP